MTGSGTEEHEGIEAANAIPAQPSYPRAMPTLPFHAGPLTHSPFFVALLLVFVTALALNTSRHRLRTHVIFGDGGDEPLRRANRAHGNAIEHVNIPSCFPISSAALSRSPGFPVRAIRS